MPDFDGKSGTKTCLYTKRVTNKEMVITTKQKILINRFNDWTAKSEMVAIYKLHEETKNNTPYFSLYNRKLAKRN